MQEIWKDIPGYEGYYQASNLGLIRSIDRTIKTKYNKLVPLKGKILKQHIDACGYSYVSMYKNNKHSTLAVHRLVAMAFIPNPENKSDVNHKNCIKTCNVVNNLEWMTRSQNVKHAFDNGLGTKYWEGKFGKHHHSSKKINQLDLNGNFIKSWDGITEASRHLPVTRKGISNALTGKSKTSAGYKWEYAD